tara:strand:+ start:495 stop:671 length:177 start_codon:yes stop_codon:yes gene_type:complete
MASTFLKNNFPSMRGAVSQTESKFLKDNLPKKDDEEEDIIKGVISNQEMKLLKSLLPQ